MLNVDYQDLYDSLISVATDKCIDFSYLRLILTNKYPTLTDEERYQIGEILVVLFHKAGYSVITYTINGWQSIRQPLHATNDLPGIGESVDVKVGGVSISVSLNKSGDNYQNHHRSQ